MSFRVCFVCTGNICRSPIAEFVLRSLADDAGLGERIIVDSAGTGSWHVGDPADPRAERVLLENGYPGRGHRARAFAPGWFAERDLVLALDRGHYRDLRALTRDPQQRRRIHLLREFDPDLVDIDRDDPRLDVADPYYDGFEAFERVLSQVERSCHGLLDHLGAQLDPSGAPGPAAPGA